ncbi:hypothetical protein B0J17DRAFT_719783 [Rhizoctonia solani]|nr:hypothetical protein B0J17DRAFT_719783 [Rhizoctonia solani]
MIPVPSSSQKPLKPILKRSASTGAAKSVTFSATNSQIFFADDWDRSAVEVVSKLSYSDVLELKQLSLDSLPSDRHASMGLSPLLSHVPLTLCPLTCEEPKNSKASTGSRAAPPSSDVKPISSPLVVPDLSILASPVSAANDIRNTPPPPLSPVSSDAGSSASVSMGSLSPRTTSESSPDRRLQRSRFNSQHPSPAFSCTVRLVQLIRFFHRHRKNLVHFRNERTLTPTTPRTPHTPSQLSPIPASPLSPTSFTSAPSQGPSPNKYRSSRKELAPRHSAPSGPKSGDFGPLTPTKSAAGSVSPVSPISPASDTTVSATSGVVRPVPRRAYTRIGSAQDLDPVARTKGSRGFDESRKAKPLAITATAWVDGALPTHHEEPESSIHHPVEPNLRPVPLPVPTPPCIQRSNSLNESQPRSFKYTNPYAQIRENDEPTSAVETTPRLHVRRASSDRTVQRTRDLPAASAMESAGLSIVPQYKEDSLGLSLPRARPPPVSMNRPVPVHRASMHGYPLGANRPPSPTPQSFSRAYPSPLSPNPPLSHQQSQPQPRSGKPLASKDANASRPLFEPKASYTLPDGGKGTSPLDRKPRSVNEAPIMTPTIATYSTPLARPKNSKVSR